MNPQYVIALGKEAILLVLTVAAPMLAFGLIVGLTISIFQAVTQINEMTLTFVPKILIVLLALLFFAPWMIEKLMQFTITTIEQIPFYIR